MNVIASMIVRDEDDVIEETLTEMRKYTDKIVVLDGGSEDKTVEIAKSFKEVELHQVNSGNNWDQAGERQLLLDLVRKIDPNCWVITVDADEIYHSNPLHAISDADSSGATIIRCQIPQFHFTEKEILDGILQTEDCSESVQKRRLYYSWGWSDFMIFKMHDDLTYLGAKEGRVTRPPYFNGNARRIEARAQPILKHYQYRSLSQYAKKMKTRRRNCEKNHKRWFRWTYENPFYNEEALNFFDGTFKDEKGRVV